MLHIAPKSAVVKALKIILKNNEITIKRPTLFDRYANHKYLLIFLLGWFLRSKYITEE